MRGDRVVTVSDDRTAKVWALPDLEGVRTLPQGGYATAVALSPDGAHIAVGSVDGLEIWNTSTWTRQQTLPGKPVALAWEGAILAVASAGSPEIVLLDGGTFAERGRLTGHHDAVHAVALSGDGANLLSGSTDGTARMWDTGSQRQLQIYVGHRGPVLTVAFGPTGGVATGSADKSAMVWHAVSGEPVRRFAGHRDWVMAVVFDTAGRDGLVTGSRDETLRVWDISTGATLKVLPTQAGGVVGLVLVEQSAVVAAESLQIMPLEAALADRAPIDVSVPDLDDRCRAALDCGVARFESKQLTAMKLWSVVTTARELSESDPRGCQRLRDDLDALEGDPPPACVPHP